jgi:hypothetical protein
MTEIITRLNHIFKGILDCGFEFQPLKELSPELWSADDLKLLTAADANSSADQPRYVESFRSGCFGFPVNAAGGCEGLAVVKGWKEGDQSRLLLLAELFTFVFESSMKMTEQKHTLRDVEEKLRMIDATAHSNNVIPLRPKQYGEALQFVESSRTPPRNPSPLLTKPLLIEASASFPLQRLALEIHQTSNRWAFVSTDDLPAEIFHSKESLQQLGAVTLFIPNISLLTTNSQLKLAEYLALGPTDEMPQVIAGTTDSAAELGRTQRVLPHLLELFFVSQLGWVEHDAAKSQTDREITADLINASLRYLVNEIRQAHKIKSHIIPFHFQYFDPDQPTMH